MTDNATMIGLAADNAERARRRIADTRQAIVDRILPSEELVAAF